MKLSHYLVAHDVTIIAFAHRIGVSRQAVHRYLAGQRRPEWDVLDRIAEQTGGKVMPNDFMAGADGRAAA